MITSIMKQWLFINYCGQKIGQLKGANVKETLLNVTTSNLSFIIYGLLLDIYVLLGFRKLWLILIIAIPFEFFVTRPLIKKHIMTIMSVQELEARYKITPRWKRIMFFILAILIVLSSVALFFTIIFSLKFFYD
ncbi:hypothetical protein [Epilithonimonas hungarica]|uniref:Uncharacterized protein n=1 Tax=Epilithonimonas hungarica TaxID=454006 RepID=A0A1G7W3E2_9FLAO|nr:hypothetical protein [Epilithonimonas hungarica]SDG66401.1 hypothetical protein SAMN05421825_3789 [Epilithonimonas hungarica]